jgi:hypothetical protein
MAGFVETDTYKNAVARGEKVYPETDSPITVPSCMFIALSTGGEVFGPGNIGLTVWGNTEGRPMGLTPEQARQLAADLITLADELDPTD